MTRTGIVRPWTAAVVALLVAAGGSCTGDGPAGQPTDTAPTDQPTTGSPTAAAPASPSTTTTEGEDGPISSSVTTGEGSTITSDVEVRVREIISDYEGEVTAEGTLLTVPARVLFDFDEASLRPDARQSLDEILEVLEFYPDAPVQVVGHTDARGSGEYNQDLSQRRARAVADYLTRNGIDGARLAVSGRGEAEPVAPNDTDAGRQRNRRVEVLIEGVEPPEVD